MKNKQVNLIVCGGSGLWTEKNHYPSILELKASGTDVRVAAICDPIDPYKPQKNEKRPNLNNILKQDKPLWINPSGKSTDELWKELDDLNSKFQTCALVVATNPTYHYSYCKWGLTRKIHIICDKPLVTAKNSAFDLHQAMQAQEQYDELLDLFKQTKKDDDRYIFCSPLRRRALTPFLKVAEGLADVYQRTDEGIRYMNVILNGGIHKYPAEYAKGGAHGHLDGVGTLSHSSYHYIDVIAWYLLLARGKAAKIEVSLPYVLRVEEYLQTESYKALRTLIEKKARGFNDKITLPPEVLNSELDFTICLRLLDENDKTVGLINYVVNYSTYAPRLVNYDPEVTEYAHSKEGGRMSSIYFDIHQGALQQWQIIKNDEVAKGHNLELRRSVHPRLGLDSLRTTFHDTYEKATLTSRDLFQYFVKSCLKEGIPAEQLAHLSTIETQGLTNKLYTAMYEKIAENFYNKAHPATPISHRVTIDLEKYL